LSGWKGAFSRAGFAAYGFLKPTADREFKADIE